MQRVVIAVGAVVVVAAALLAYYLLGGSGQEAARVAEQPAAQGEAADTAPPAPPQATSSSASSSTPSTAAAPEASAPAGSSPPVVQVKPRAPAAPSSGAATAAGARPEPAPAFDVVRVEKSGDAVIAGRAQPDSEVTVTTQDGTALGSARADSAGSWAIVTQKPLAPGSHEIGIEERDVKGDSRLSEEVVVVVVPEPAAPAAVPAEKAAAAEASAGQAQPGQQVLAVLTPRAGGASKVLPQEEDGIAHGNLVLDSVDYNENGRAVVGGRAAPGSRVLLYMNNRLVGDTRAGSQGRWSHALEQPVAEGLHSLRVDQVDDQGGVLARVETPFSREPVRVASADGDVVIVQPGNSLWRIARRTYGQGVQYTVIYQANQDLIRDPDLIYPGQVFELPKIN